LADKIGNSSQYGGAGGQGQTLEPNEIQKQQLTPYLLNLQRKRGKRALGVFERNDN
tara:strand:- start:155 stop:322 length:168 start_codon:yes stop_codon:yes gene_type:complete